MFRYREAIGLDICDGVANIVFARRWGFAAKICVTHSIRLAEDPEETVQVLKGFFEKQDWLDIPCVVGLRGDALMLRVVSCQSDDRRNVNDVLEEQMAHFATLSEPATVSEYTVSRGKRGDRQIMLAVARMDTVLKTIDYVRKVGMDIVDLIPSPVALYNADVHLLPWSGSPIMCVDVGEESTQVVIGQGRTLNFARRFLLGNKLLAEEEGEEDQGRLFATGNEDDQYDDVSPGSLNEWLAELKGCLNFYNSRARLAKMQPKKLLLSGIKSRDQEVLNAIEEAIGIDTVAVGQLEKAAKFDGNDSLVGATGFALAGLGKERVHLSLLPQYLKEVFALRWQFKYWVVSGLALIFAAMLIVLGLRRDVDHKKALIKTKTERVEKLDRLENELSQLKSANRELIQQIVPLRIAVDNGRIIKVVLNAVSEAKHRDDWITLIADSASYFDENLGDKDFNGASVLGRNLKGEYPIQRFNRIVLEGYTPLNDLSTVRAMIETLRETEMIDDVDLLADDKIREDPTFEEELEGIDRTLFAIELKVVKQ